MGDNMNYFVGRAIGPRLFNRPKSFFFNPAHLHHTRDFYERHGGKTIIMARASSPSSAPARRLWQAWGRCSYRRFILFCVGGACLWVPIGVLSGYFLGQQPFVKSHFSLIILAIVFISLLPPAIQFFRSRRREQARTDECSSMARNERRKPALHSEASKFIVSRRSLLLAISEN